MNLKEQLRRYLEHHNITVSELARKASVPKSTIHEWLQGSMPRNIDKLKSVATILNVSLDQLCYGEKILKITSNPMDSLQEEIHAGKFEVVLRPIYEDIKPLK
jgi:transcriptional regulator with XRE-family HTH domain